MGLVTSECKAVVAAWTGSRFGGHHSRELELRSELEISAEECSIVSRGSK